MKSFSVLLKRISFTTLTWVSIVGLFVQVSLSTDSPGASPDVSPVPLPGGYHRICPLPRCTKCPSDEEIQAPGIRFALETSHGAVVVRFHDGSYRSVALLEGDGAYTALLRRLATGPITRIPDHIDSNWEKWLYLKARAQRRLNKLLGRPATPETAILAAMVSKLQTAAQNWIGDEYPVAAAVLSSPDRIRLTDEEIDDVFDYLKLKNLMTEFDLPEHLYSTSAAYTGYGQGLCSNPTDISACEREEHEFPMQRILHVDINHESLSGTIKSLQCAKRGLVEALFIDPTLGYRHGGTQNKVIANENGNSDSDGEEYWTAVSVRIRELVISFKPQITKLLLTGTYATDSRFRFALRDALQDVVAKEVLAVLDRVGGEAADEDEWRALFHFATARGAAEFAKRRQEGPVACRESEECKRRRHRGEPPMLGLQKQDL